MQTQNISTDNAAFKIPIATASFEYVSPRTFNHCLNALLIHTKALAGNVLSLHLHLAVGARHLDGIPTILSGFQLELLGQALALQRHAETLQCTNLQPMDGIDYAYLWHFKDIGDTPAALSRLKETTNYLAGLYESVLPAAAVQPDQATSFYMLAGHLITLDAFCMILERNLEAVQ